MAWHRNLYEPLVDLGHDVFLCSTREGNLARRNADRDARADFSERLLSVFKIEHQKRPFDLFFGYFIDGMLDFSIMADIRRLVPTCNFSCNNVHQFNLVKDIARHFDINLYTEKQVGDKFRKINVSAIWWPLASNPRYYHPTGDSRSLQMSFVGAMYGNRPYWIHALLEGGVQIHVFGPGWEYSRYRWLRSRARRVLVLSNAAFGRSVWEKARASARLADLDRQ